MSDPVVEMEYIIVQSLQALIALSNALQYMRYGADAHL
jgi:hypothetical protein